MTPRKEPSQDLLKRIPHARPVFPDHPLDQLKYIFWIIITPLHPHVRDLLRYMRVLRNQGRQNYLLGRLAPGETVEGFVEFLLEKGFGNHFIAFEDDGQLVSLRYSPNFRYQYHIRVFHDGEVRGHYEYAPEHRPILHMKQVGMEARFDDFFTLLEGRIIPAPLAASSNFTWSFLGTQHKD